MEVRRHHHHHHQQAQQVLRFRLFGPPTDDASQKTQKGFGRSLARAHTYKVIYNSNSHFWRAFLQGGREREVRVNELLLLRLLVSVPKKKIQFLPLSSFGYGEKKTRFGSLSLYLSGRFVTPEVMANEKKMAGEDA